MSKNNEIPMFHESPRCTHCQYLHLSDTPHDCWSEPTCTKYNETLGSTDLQGIVPCVRCIDDCQRRYLARKKEQKTTIEEFMEDFKELLKKYNLTKKEE